MRSILGDGYVNMTEDNIQNGDPLAVYNNTSTFGDFNSFFLIAMNNLRVGLMSFLYGLFGGIGSMYFMLVNGVMVGSFQYMFFEKGHFFPFTQDNLDAWSDGNICNVHRNRSRNFDGN